jgi:lysosomal alpha-mannosidase
MLLSESNEDLTKSSLNAGKTLILLNDRAQGGTSMRDGELEMMVHRRLLHDDAFGVGEALNESAYGSGLVVRGKHWLLLAGGDTGVPVSLHRSLAQQIAMDRLYAFRSSMGQMESEKMCSRNGLEESLATKLGQLIPDNINLLTLEKLSDNQILIRLEHFYEKNEDAVLSQPAIVSTEKLCQVFECKDIREATLGGNQWKTEAKRFDWTAENEKMEFEDRAVPTKVHDDDIVLNPMQIRTFVVFT